MWRRVVSAEHRPFRAAVTIGVAAALLAPMATGRDGFPLSTYPMYSRTRSRVVTVATATGVGDDGTRSTLSLELVGSSDDPLIVAGELRAAIAGGRAGSACRDIADRVAGRGDRSLATIEVVVERLDAVESLTTGTVDDADGLPAGLVDRTVHASCPVPGGQDVDGGVDR